MASGSMQDDDDAPMSDINVTPLVDVMLVLLIVFMITMPVLTHSIPLNLPVGSSQREQPQQDIKPLQVAVDLSGRYALGTESDQKISLDEIKQAFATAAARDPNTVVAIDADKEVAYEHVVKVLEAAREAGLSKIGFRMETPPVQP